MKYLILLFLLSISLVHAGTDSRLMGTISGAKNSSPRFDFVKIDSATNALVTTTYEHHEIHGGSHYYMEGFVTLATAGTHYVKLVTPNTTKWSHFSWIIESSGILEVTLYEGVSGGMTGGSSMSPLNNNRNSSNTSGMTITSGVTVASDLGTTVGSKKVGGTAFKSVTGGGDSRGSEIILKQNTTYLRKFLSGSDDNIISFRASWYEHTSVAR